MEEYQWIEGAVAVEAVLQAQSREMAELLISRDRFDGPVARLQHLARQTGMTVSRVPAAVIDEHAPNKSHGGGIARVGPRRMSALADLFASPASVIFVLDGVEDPYNFGQAVRSMYAAGIDGLIVPTRNWLSAAATVIRASAGATEHMPTATAATADAAAMARLRRIPIGVATAEKARPMGEFDLTGPLLLLIGGEKRGVARAMEEMADWRVSIPYGRETGYALGTAAAAAILSFEVLRQRQAKG